MDDRNKMFTKIIFCIATQLMFKSFFNFDESSLLSGYLKVKLSLVFQINLAGIISRIHVLKFVYNGKSYIKNSFYLCTLFTWVTVRLTVDWALQ
jgi:hypothetical protein